ncbi:MAG: hypothetical protein IPK03_17570 [Bacteroidetes bacterium]|nr:hypothetical protein [Bacteroidota bacterium]
MGTGNYAIYRGVGDSFSISNLNPNTTYHAAIYEFNGSGVCYKSPALLGNFTTRCEVPTGQASISLVSPGITSAVVNFLSGTGGNARLLILSDSLLFNDPIDTTDPSANNNYSGSGARVVYNSNGTRDYTRPLFRIRNIISRYSSELCWQSKTLFDHSFHR